MGKVDEDLPDPLSSDGAGAAQSADELLAQLASSEVDRLLAEAELERPARPAAANAPAPARAVALGMPPEADLATISRAGDGPLAEQPPGAEEPDAEAMERVDAETARQLDKLFDELQPGGEKAAAATASQTVEPTPPAPITAAAVAAAADAGSDANLNAQLSDLFTQLTGADGSAGGSQVTFADPDEGTGEAERQVLASELLAASALAGEEEADEAEEAAGVPWYLKPLEWLNAPLARCSDRMREVLGKVAIVTLVNAVAVLLYVVLVRRR